MRVPNEAALSSAANPLRRYQLWLLIAVVTVIVLLVVVQGVADLFTNYLWYRSVRADDVWRTMTGTKIELAVFFTGVFFIACWLSLLVVDRVAPRALFMSPEQEFVRRYQALVGRHRFAVRTAVSFFVALILGNGTASQWQHWMLFLHGGTFGVKDPQFHKDVGFFVFKLPFLSFLVDWTQVALIVLALVCAAAYYMNGGLRFSGPSPRVDPRATAHFSVIFAALALVRAVGYFYVDRYALDIAPNGLFQGAGYTAVHVRLPALNLLAIVALTAFVMFVVNIYARSWMLPVVAAGLWAFIGIGIGVVFPWAVQSLQVTPAASTLELPYLQHNIEATRTAFGLDNVKAVTFPGAADATAGVVKDDAASLENVDLWDPTVSAQTYQILQRIKGFYSINGTSLDRYQLNVGPNNASQLTPVDIAVREISPSNLNRTTWVNTHLVDTHGYGVTMAPANTTTPGPKFNVQSIPVQESSGAPQLTQPDVYYGVGETGYVVVHSAQPEYDYQSNGTSGSVVTNSYSGPGGIRIGSIWQKAAFALRFHDFNLLVSKLVTPSSRIMYNQDVRTLVQKVAPFLKVDSNPYPVIDGGHIDWIVDAYTTTSYYPYSQAATGSSLATGFNYIRNSVKAVVDAYTGQVTLYAWDQSDPILRTWERVFPGMFLPKSQMDSTLRSHLRYPQNLLSVEATMFGKYHVTLASSFYNNSAAWQVSLAGSSGPPVQPVYQLLALPGQSQSTFSAFLPLVPSGSGRAQNLTSFVVANCSYDNYGQLTAYVVPQGGTPVNGPAIANGLIDSNKTVAGVITLLDQLGSKAVFGPTLLIPIDDSLVYVRALFGVSISNALPQLDYITVDYGGKVAISKTLLGPGGALTQVIGPAIASVGSAAPTSVPAEIASEIKSAQQLETAAYAALRSGDLAKYATDEAQLKTLLTQISQQLAKFEAHKGKPGTPSGTTSTTTTVPPASSTTTTSLAGHATTSTSVGGA